MVSEVGEAPPCEVEAAPAPAKEPMASAKGEAGMARKATPASASSSPAKRQAARPAREAGGEARGTPAEAEGGGAEGSKPSANGHGSSGNGGWEGEGAEARRARGSQNGHGDPGGAAGGSASPMEVDATPARTSPGGEAPGDGVDAAGAERAEAEEGAGRQSPASPSGRGAKDRPGEPSAPAAGEPKAEPPRGDASALGVDAEGGAAPGGEAEGPSGAAEAASGPPAGEARAMEVDVAPEGAGGEAGEGSEKPREEGEGGEGSDEDSDEDLLPPPSPPLTRQARMEAEKKKLGNSPPATPTGATQAEAGTSRPDPPSAMEPGTSQGAEKPATPASAKKAAAASPANDGGAKAEAKAKPKAPPLAERGHPGVQWAARGGRAAGSEAGKASRSRRASFGPLSRFVSSIDAAREALAKEREAAAANHASTSGASGEAGKLIFPRDLSQANLGGSKSGPESYGPWHDSELLFDPSVLSARWQNGGRASQARAGRPSKSESRAGPSQPPPKFQRSGKALELLDYSTDVLYRKNMNAYGYGHIAMIDPARRLIPRSRKVRVGKGPVKLAAFERLVDARGGAVERWAAAKEEHERKKAEKRQQEQREKELEEGSAAKRARGDGGAPVANGVASTAAPAPPPPPEEDPEEKRKEQVRAAIGKLDSEHAAQRQKTEEARSRREKVAGEVADADKSIKDLESELEELQSRRRDLIVKLKRVARSNQHQQQLQKSTSQRSGGEGPTRGSPFSASHVPVGFLSGRPEVEEGEVSIPAARPLVPGGPNSFARRSRVLQPPKMLHPGDGAFGKGRWGPEGKMWDAPQMLPLDNRLRMRDSMDPHDQARDHMLKHSTSLPSDYQGFGGAESSARHFSSHAGGHMNHASPASGISHAFLPPHLHQHPERMPSHLHPHAHTPQGLPRSLSTPAGSVLSGGGPGGGGTTSVGALSGTGAGPERERKALPSPRKFVW